MSTPMLRSRWLRLFPVTMVGLVCLAQAGMNGCSSYDNGTSRTRTTRTVDTPEQRSTTTTTRERKVEDYPR